MAQRTHVPKFGNWDNAANVPYTQYFDNARKGKSSGKLINPNDPEENPEAFSKEALSNHSPPVRTRSDPEAQKPKHRRHPSSVDSDPHRPINSALHHIAAGRKLTSDSPHHRYGVRVNSGENQRRASRNSGGSVRSIEQSPLHPSYHVKSVSKGGVSSPSWERRVSSEGHGHTPHTPGRSKMRPGSRDDDMSEKGSTVPMFGSWDENNPASADGFTHIFNKVREEKQIGPKKIPVISHDPYPNVNKRLNSDSVTCWCFSFGKK